ncbi:MAG TPA: hypothetical protein VKB05_14240 [Pyrinomonadaceae bacterium]|nr:hypothetical protein [Pyrinomonadaceae bacterium]
MPHIEPQKGTKVTNEEMAQAREAEWKSYSHPQTNFARQLNPEKP